MTVELKKYVLSAHRESPRWREVSLLAKRLLTELNSASTAKRIREANAPGRSSADVQSAFLPSAEMLGFSSEKQGLFAGSIRGLRPDYFKRVGDTGVILEVERGKTTTNNMDLLDFWKCHICEGASFLFLMVPRELRHNPTMSPKREFKSVARRLEPFFREGNETNVHGLCLFGY